MRRAALVVALAALVALAGCGGSNTTSPSPTGTDGPDAAPYPPGVSESGLNNSELLSAHQSTLRNESFELVINNTVNGQPTVVTQRVDDGWSRLLVEIDRPDGLRQEFYADGTLTLREDGNVTTSEQRFPGALRITASFDLRAPLRAATFTPEGTVERDGETLVELTASLDDLNPDAVGGNVTEFEGRVLVGPEGAIRLLDVRFAGTVDGESFTQDYRFTVSGIGETSVDRPDWA